MAVARGNAGTVSWNMGINWTYTLPTNSADDIMILCVWMRGGLSSNSISVSTSGWMQIVQQAGSSQSRFSLWWKRSTGSESTVSGSCSTGGTVHGKAWTYTGCITSGSPIDGTPTSGSSNSTSASCGSVAPTNNNGMVVGVTCDSDNSSWSAQAVTDPATLSEWTDENNAPSNASIALADGLQTTAGATGSFSATKDKGADEWGCGLFVLQEQAAGGTTKTFASASTSPSAAAASLSPTRSFVSASTSASAASAAISATKVLAAVSVSDSVVAATLAATRVFAGLSVSESTAVAALSRVKSFAGSIVSPSANAATASITRALAAASLSSSAVSAILTNLKGFAALSDSVSGAAALLSSTRTLAATSVSLSEAAAAVNKVKAFEATVLNYGLATGYAGIDSYLAMYSGDVIERSQSFQGLANKHLAYVDVYLRRTGSAPGNVVVRIYAHSGVYGTSSVPTGPVLAQSLPIAASSLILGGRIERFYFVDSFKMSAVNYCLTIFYDAGDASNAVHLGVDTTAPTHSGNSAYYISSWVADNTRDHAFGIYYGGSIIEADVNRTRGMTSAAVSPSAAAASAAVNRPFISASVSSSVLSASLARTTVFASVSTSESAAAASLTIPVTAAVTFSAVVTSLSAIAAHITAGWYFESATTRMWTEEAESNASWTDEDGVLRNWTKESPR